MKRTVLWLSVLRRLVGRLRSRPPGVHFPGSAEYWRARYVEGRTSGAGSYGALAAFKAEVLNEFVSSHTVATVLELGCGDGNQLGLANYPDYTGVDVAPAAVETCRERFGDDPTKRFLYHSDEALLGLRAELVLSLDVIYHLVEDEILVTHLEELFGAADRFVILYTSDLDRSPGLVSNDPHVRHRFIGREVAQRFPDWRLRERIPNRFPYVEGDPSTSFAEFLIYERVVQGGE